MQNYILFNTHLLIYFSFLWFSPISKFAFKQVKNYAFFSPFPILFLSLSSLFILSFTSFPSPFVRIRGFSISGQSFSWDRSVTLEECWRFVFFVSVLTHPWPAALLQSYIISWLVPNTPERSESRPPSLCVCWGVCPRLAWLPSHTRTWFLSPCRHLCHCGCVLRHLPVRRTKSNSQLWSLTLREPEELPCTWGGDLNPTPQWIYDITKQKLFYLYMQTTINEIDEITIKTWIMLIKTLILEFMAHYTVRNIQDTDCKAVD